MRYGRAVAGRGAGIRRSHRDLPKFVLVKPCPMSLLLGRNSAAMIET
jgi:hypothetical protein